jgi:hypothetical protein
LPQLRIQSVVLKRKICNFALPTTLLNKFESAVGANVTQYHNAEAVFLSYLEQ